MAPSRAPHTQHWSNGAFAAQRSGVHSAGPFIPQNGINRSMSWHVYRIILVEFSVFTMMSVYEMTVYIITGKQEEEFTLRLMPEGGAFHLLMMWPLFQTQRCGQISLNETVEYCWAPLTEGASVFSQSPCNKVSSYHQHKWPSVAPGWSESGRALFCLPLVRSHE